ncbi:unnamed protein product, partial [Durusdinium trenchii]
EPQAKPSKKPSAKTEKAYKYQYHALKKYGIKYKNSELLTESLTSDRVAAAEKNTVSVPEVSASASAGTDAVPPVTDDADDGEQAEEEAMEVDE